MEYEDLIYILHFQDRDYDRRLPNEDDWEACRKFVKFLKLFYNATKRFSSSLYVTSNAFFDEIYMIKRKIDLFSRSEDHFLYSMAKTMKEEFDKYWGSEEDSSKKGNVLLYVVVVLDPRKKLDYLNYCLSNLYGENVAKVITDLQQHHLHHQALLQILIDLPTYIGEFCFCLNLLNCGLSSQFFELTIDDMQILFVWTFCLYFLIKRKVKVKP